MEDGRRSGRSGRENVLHNRRRIGGRFQRVYACLGVGACAGDGAGVLTAATPSAGHHRSSRHGQPQAHRVVLEVSVVDQHERRLQQRHGQGPRGRGIPTLEGHRHP